MAGHSTSYVNIIVNRINEMLKSWKSKREVVVVPRNTGTIVEDSMYCIWLKNQQFNKKVCIKP